MARPKIIAVDGPAGSGKSSVCAEVCRRIHWTYVNTGALYRAVALIAVKEGVDFEDATALTTLTTRFCAEVSWEPVHGQLIFAGEDLVPELVTSKAGNDASYVARLDFVRALLLPVQRRLALLSPVGALIDGRDIGTVVFPDADLKIFMTASLAERAKRRRHQLLEKNNSSLQPTLAEIMDDIAKRDQQDSERGTAPLRQAQDAALLDTSGMDTEAAVQALIQLLRDRQLLIGSDSDARV